MVDSLTSPLLPFEVMTTVEVTGGEATLDEPGVGVDDPVVEEDNSPPEEG